MWKLFSKVLFFVALTSSVDGFFWNKDTLKNQFEEFKKSYSINITCIENKIDESRKVNKALESIEIFECLHGFSGMSWELIVMIAVGTLLILIIIITLVKCLFCK